MATPSPSGNATSAERNEIITVPTTSGTTPNWPSRKRGVQVVPVRKSHGLTSVKNSSAGCRSDATIPTVVITEIAAARKRTPWTTTSPQRILFLGSAPPVRAAATSSAILLRAGFLELGALLRDLVVAQRDEPSRLGDRRVVVEHERDEALDRFLLLEGAALDVDEEGPRERRVGPVLRGLRARRHA